MKTVIIWDMCRQEPLSFFIVAGDQSHLDKIFINNADQDMSLQDELNDLIYNEAGQYKLKQYKLKQYKLKQYKKLPRKAIANPTNKVIISGFFP
jgi:hypothetical protein